MKALIFFAAVFFAALAESNLPAQAASLPDPIAPAANGQLQCYSPDTARKTCNSLASYKPGANGTIDNIAVVLISSNPVITMEASSPVEIKDSKICGKIRKQDIGAAKFKVGGQSLDATQAAPLRQQMRRSYANIFDREICTAYLDKGGILLSKATLDGVPMPASTDQQVLWVSPRDGYGVGP
jgi:hypothetical protein